MLHAAKRETDKEASEASNEEDGTNPVSLLELLRDGELCCGIHANEPCSNDKANTTEWVVNMKAPEDPCQPYSTYEPGSPHQRHEAFSTRAPPTTGPTMLPIDHEPRTMAKYFGRCLRGTISQKITCVMVMMPPPPIPWTDRPVSNTVKLRATEQSMVPTVNCKR